MTGAGLSHEFHVAFDHLPVDIEFPADPSVVLASGPPQAVLTCEFPLVDTRLTPNGVFATSGPKGGFRKSLSRNGLGYWATQDLNL